jgi:hypothetical protein
MDWNETKHNPKYLYQNSDNFSSFITFGCHIPQLTEKLLTVHGRQCTGKLSSSSSFLSQMLQMLNFLPLLCIAVVSSEFIILSMENTSKQF